MYSHPDFEIFGTGDYEWGCPFRPLFTAPNGSEIRRFFRGLVRYGDDFSKIPRNGYESGLHLSPPR